MGPFKQHFGYSWNSARELGEVGAVRLLGALYEPLRAHTNIKFNIIYIMRTNRIRPSEEARSRINRENGPTETVPSQVGPK